MTREIINDVVITDIADEGKAIGRSANRIIFVAKAVPGDVVDVLITKKRNTYAEGRVIETKKLSELRTTPFCEHFGVCGGCKWQHFDYSAQLQYKQKQVLDALTRIGKVDNFELLPIRGCDIITHYRNRLDYAFCNKKWLTKEDYDNRIGWNEAALGFHLPGLFDKILDINTCHLQDDLTNKIRNAVKKYAWDSGLTFYDYRKQTGYLRSLILRNTVKNDWMAIVVLAYEDERKHIPLLDFIADSFPEIKSLVYVINRKKNDTIFDQEVITYKGDNYITEWMNNLQFRISPKSFFQTNTLQAIKLYEVALDFAALTGNETVYDLYTGTGTIANFVAHKAKKVVGIEYVEDAIKDAHINSGINNIGNTYFFAGDIKNVFNTDFLQAHGVPDVIITDPPRAGMHEDVTRNILRSDAGKIVYVSCNPATQARDVEILSGNYTLIKSQPVDMFPHTHHVENVVLMEKK